MHHIHIGSFSFSSWTLYPEETLPTFKPKGTYAWGNWTEYCLSFSTDSGCRSRFHSQYLAKLNSG
jgi:hypothetical protein